MAEGTRVVDEVRLLAPAKVNLTLRILGRMPSGFHELESLFQAVDLCDELVVRRTEGSGTTLEVAGADVGPVDDNLVVRAALAFREAGGIDTGLALRLDKRIPAGAGLGGGSSDAGATLRALDHMFPKAVSGATLRALAADLGSDVPFFIGPAGLELGRGRGEILRALDPLPAAHLVLGLPPVHVPTGPTFGALARARRERGGRLPEPLFDAHPIPSTWSAVAALAVNDFEDSVAATYPEVASTLTALRSTDPLMTLLSGSGGTVFAVYTDAAAAEAARREAAGGWPSIRFERVATLATLPGLNASGRHP